MPDSTLERRLAIELFRRLRWGGLVPLFFVPALTLGCGYNNLLSWWVLSFNFILVLVRGWMAFRAYADSVPDPNPETALGWLRWIRVASILQSAGWWVLSTFMMLDFGRTENGYFVLACSVGWTMASPAFFAPDLVSARITSVLNPVPLLIWNLVGTPHQSALLLVLGLLAFSVLSAHMQHGYVKGAYRAQLALEQAQHELRTAKDLAERAAAAKGEFLATMSHEIRTPLNGVIGLAEILYQHDLDGTVKEIAGDLRSSGRHLLSIVNDVLDLSKIDAGKMTVESVPIAVRKLLLHCVADFQPQAREKSLLLSCEIEDDLPEIVLGDPVRVRQIAGNLISNAVKFTPAGEVAVHASRESDEWLRIAVRDTGIGIPPARQEAVFEKFTQAETSTARRFGGTGLGLSISRQLAELMGGSLNVESKHGLGSTFSLRIPLRVPAGETSALAQDAHPGQTASWGLPRDFRILVVDDNPVNLRICVHFTQKSGAIVDSASSGRAAIAMHVEAPYDLILMDCHMPELDGWQTTAKIRQLDGKAGQVPVYALTADVFPEVHERCQEAGMNGYLSKPLQVEELREALRTHALRRAEQ
jgi:signal transduction histidine kinase/ActR/RegA family two-component response regulator